MATPSATKTRRKTTFNSNGTPKTLTPKSHCPNSASISSSIFKSVYLKEWWRMKAQGKGLAVTPKTLTPNSHFPNSASISSSIFKSVFLEDWWLVKAQGKGLAVGGFSYNEMHGVRLFCSDAIATRHDTTTLETTDGFTVSISCYINRSRTRLNGFPSEVCDKFLLGFPYDWEDYTAQCFCEKFSDGCVPNRVSAFDEFSKSSGEKGDSVLLNILDGVRVARARNLVMSTLGDSGNSTGTDSTFDDIPGKLGGKPFNITGESTPKADENDSNEDFAQDDTPSNHKKAKVHNKMKDRNVILNARNMRTEKYNNGTSQSKMGVNVLTVNCGVVTRSMAKRRSTQNHQEEGLSFSSRAASQQQGRVTRSTSNTSRATNLIKEKKKARKVLDKSALKIK